MDPTSTKSLLVRGQRGDRSAIDLLFHRIFASVRRWAHGRVPKGARRIIDTADVVQEAALGLLRRLDAIHLERPGDLEAYIRRAVRNRITDESRRLVRVPEPRALDSAIPGREPSPFQSAQRSEFLMHYAEVLAKLDEQHREVLIAKFEMGLSYEAIARLLGKPSAAAARMTVNRALERVRTLLEDSKSDGR